MNHLGERASPTLHRRARSVAGGRNTDRDCADRPHPVGDTERLHELALAPENSKEQGTELGVDHRVQQLEVTTPAGTDTVLLNPEQLIAGPVATVRLGKRGRSIDLG